MPAQPDRTPADHLAAVTRRVNTLTRNADQVRTMTLVRPLDIEPSEVWAAVSDPGQLDSWLAPVEGELSEGGRYRVEGLAAGEVVLCRAPERFSVSWESDGRTSWVDLSLRPVGDGTLLQLDHAVPLDDHLARVGPAGVGLGWELALIALAAHLHDPGSPRRDQDADLAALLPDAADEWVAAAVADGADEVTAREQARRAAASYGG